MPLHDSASPFTKKILTESFVAIDVTRNLDHGQHVRAVELSSLDYKIRFGKLNVKNNMKALAGCDNDSPGYLVVGKPNSRHKYETWLPESKFKRLYKKVSPQYVAYYPPL